MTRIIITVVSFFGAGVVLTILGLATKAYVAAEVANQLAAAGIVPEHEVAELRKDVETNASDIDGIETRWNALVDALAAQRVP